MENVYEPLFTLLTVIVLLKWVFMTKRKNFKTRREMADELGISLRTFYRYLKECGLTFSGRLLCKKAQKEIRKRFRSMGFLGDE